MDFQLTEDQRAFADIAQALFADFCNDEQLRAFDASGLPFMQDLWQQCVAGGLHAILVPEDGGGLGLGMAELMGVLEQQGRALAPVPLWEHQLALAAALRFGSDPLCAALKTLPADALLTLSLGGLAAARGPALEARREGAGFRLDGCAAAVPLGAQAAWLLAGVVLDGAPRLMLLDLANGAIGKAEGVAQHHLAVADLVFDGVQLPVSALLAEPALDWVEPRAIACLAALQLGVSLQQLGRTVEYVSERKQFNRVIGSFQLVAGQMADGHIAAEALRSSLWQLVYRIDAGLGCAPQGWATRFLACGAGHRIGHMAQHVHGGIGVDVTFPIHRFLFWSRVLGVTLGGAEHNLAKLGDWLADHNTLGWKYDLPEDHAV
ncbi:acyl-CoA dehydrogenase family protein [Massilia cavernae]|uniref:Acyl-CoA dehydrogenase n=1 Tax=Massilia cavernae TaxID=2320864 RepID=A0A418Y0W0_9BURK|nr:acyl-CoA dehydrogenase family protein [Massilia cavernae]RJG19017.1 acyl-CoA dehydrogenase [Massilia cavernae]